jgi:bifunctional non-homologous end joining protein LigD
MADRLDEYRRRRDPRRTPEPVPTGRPHPGHGDRFVIQQHHARRLHWDLRLERDGVLASWAVPRGLPRDQGRNGLAVHTEDHPLEYLDFSGEIPTGEYGGGRMTIHDRGTYDTEKWRDDEVMVVLHGERHSGRYVLFRTGGRDWMIRRMDPPEPGWESMPGQVAPMLPARAATLPPDDADWAYEMAWGGRRALAYVSGGRLRLLSADGDEVTSSYPELRAMAEDLAPTECVLDGEIVTFDPAGRIDAALLERRSGVTGSAAARRVAARTPVHYLLYDLLWLEGRSTVELLRYTERRELLDGLAPAGANWQTPPFFAGGGGFALEASRTQGLTGVVAKRLDSPYLPGRRSRLWLTVAGRSG